MKSDTGISPNVPGTDPVTDVPPPGNNSSANEPGGADVHPGGSRPGREQSATASTSQDRPPGPGTRTSQETNPFSGSPTGGVGGVDPSGPTAGTEDWGGRPDEFSATASPTEQTPNSGETASPEAIGRKESGPVSFRCSQLHPDCKWEASGRGEDELMPRIEQHGRTEHGSRSFGQEMKDRIRSLIRRTAA